MIACPPSVFAFKEETQLDYIIVLEVLSTVTLHNLFKFGFYTMDRFRILDPI